MNEVHFKGCFRRNAADRREGAIHIIGGFYNGYFKEGSCICLSLIHISEPTRLGMISYAVFCLKKKKKAHGRDPVS